MLTKKAKYAIKALLALADSEPEEPIRIADLARAEQNQLEEFRGDLFCTREIRDAHGLLGLTVGEREECFDGVLGFLGEHSLFA